MREPLTLSQRLLAHLHPCLHAPAWHVAFSGGLDSTVLLHLLAHMPGRPPLTAIHVHHGLQPIADTWPGHCQRFCDSLGIPLTISHVRIATGASLEQAARNARYQAFEKLLQPGELLLTAQHRDDQAETLLFRLLRGTGVRGLAAMPRVRRLGQGRLLRPMLDEPRQTLLEYARQHRLNWIEDPSNADTEFSRNYLRREVIPVITQRWPQAATSMARTASHLSEALELLQELAADDLRPAQIPSPWPWLGVPSLALAPLAALSEARQRNALQNWLAPLTRLPDAQHWAGWTTLRDAGADATPVWRLADGELQRGGGRVWWISGRWSQAQPSVQAWAKPDAVLALPDNGLVRWQGDRVGEVWQIRYRQGGETLLLPGRGRRDLKRLLNESGLPGFVRARLPLLYVDGELQAVANLPLGRDANARLIWTTPTSDQSLR